MAIAIRYALFAALATLANIATQEIVTHLPGWAGTIYVSMAAGTIAGFVMKYILDKLWIFEDKYTTHKAEARKVVLYGVSSVLTTCVFWLSELGFWVVWKEPVAKYFGAVFGLTIGYIVKFQLDRMFVFNVRDDQIAGGTRQFGAKAAEAPGTTQRQAEHPL